MDLSRTGCVILHLELIFFCHDHEIHMLKVNLFLAVISKGRALTNQSKQSINQTMMNNDQQQQQQQQQQQ